MASAPSASALTAVLRCPGNILTRSPPAQRPSGSAYSLGLTGRTVRDSPAANPHPTPTWEAFLQGARLVVGGRLTVQYSSPQVNGKAMVGEDSGEIAYPKKPGARSGGPGAPVRQLAVRLPSNLLGPEKYSEIIRVIKRDVQLSDKVFAGGIHEATGVLKVSVSTRESPGHIACVWSGMRRTCLSLTAFLSEVMFCKLTGMVHQQTQRCVRASAPADCARSNE